MFLLDCMYMRSPTQNRTWPLWDNTFLFSAGFHVPCPMEAGVLLLLTRFTATSLKARLLNFRELKRIVLVGDAT